MLDDLDVATCAFCTTTEQEDELYECSDCGKLFCSEHGNRETELCEDCS